MGDILPDREEFEDATGFQNYRQGYEPRNTGIHVQKPEEGKSIDPFLQTPGEATAS